MRTYKCGHSAGDTAVFESIFGDQFGGQYCDDCIATKRLYDDMYMAMAGNVYSLARLAEAGLIPGIRPTLADLYRASNTLFARLSPAAKESEK